MLGATQRDKAPPPATMAVETPLMATRAAGDEGHERQRIVDALAQCAGNQTRAAKLLRISRATLVHKIALHRIPRPRS
jgi:DNA-binding NtrC family response regulator